MAERIEGRNPVLEALRAGRSLIKIRIADGVKPDRAIDEIKRLARDSGVRVENVPRRVLDAESDHGAHQGVVADARPFVYATLEQVLRETADTSSALIIVLDHVTDPGNLGAVARSAEVAGATAVVVAKDRSAPVTSVTRKAAAGALEHLPLVQVTNVQRTLQALKDAGWWVAGASEKAKMVAWDAPLEGRLVLVMGAEGTGLSRLVEEHCDFLVRLPVAGHVDSLNVAQATSVLAFEWVRRREGSR